MRPKIQLALDCLSIEEAIKACQSGVVDEVDILECGYCLINIEGARVVKIFREIFPDKPLLADPNIVDASKKIGGALLDGRPDYMTILCNCERGTIAGVQEEAAKRGLNPKLQIELYGHWSYDDIPMWKEMGITQLTLQHSGDKPGTWDEEEIATLTELAKHGIPVAATGAISINELELFRGIPVSTFIFGRAILNADDPVQMARDIKAKIAEIWPE